MSQAQIERERNTQYKLQLAEKFYETDQELNTSQRKQLATAFNNQLRSNPLGSFPGLLIGITVPLYAHKYKLLKVKSPRYIQVFTGFVGLIVGSRVASYVSRKRSLSRLEQSSSNAVEVFNLLYPYPPQIGYTYYDRTAKDASKIMKDPRTIDWDHEFQFPLNLALNQEEINQSRRERERELPQSRRDQRLGSPSEYSPKSDNEPQSTLNDDLSFDGLDSGSASEVDQQGTGGSTWDAIRAQRNTDMRGGFPSSKSGTASKYPPIPPSPPSTTSTTTSSWPISTNPPEQDRNSGWPSSLPARPAQQPNEMTDDQNEFDRELELERQGYGVKDDFTSSEKKWK